MIDLAQVVILGLLLGGVYALMASGLTLIFGVMQVVNLAHGAFIILGAYFAYFAFEFAGIDPFVSMLMSLPIFFGLGVVLYRFLFRRIEGSEQFGEMTVLLTFGLAFVLEGVMSFFFTGIFRTVNVSYATESFRIGDFFIPKGQLFASLASVGLILILWIFLKKTKVGNGVRATMQNRDAAQLVGVNVRGVSTISFGIGIALAGAAGTLVSFIFPFFPARHWQWIALLLALVVVGGLGSIKGAVIAALVLSVLSSLVSDTLGPVWAPLTFFLSLFVILLVRPQGLFGKVGRA